MIVTRYKPLFSVSATYKLATFNVSAEGVSVKAVAKSEAKMSNLKLKPIYNKNTATVYYEGIETPANLPVTSEPSLEITTTEYFYFGVDLAGKEKLKGLKFHSSAAIAKATGFPLLYDAEVSGGTGVLTIREDIKVVAPIFTFTVIAADAGITGSHATLEIRNESNVLQYLDMKPAALNDKSIEGGSAVPEFAFSVDASKLEAGIYEFKAGSFTKKYFIASNIDVSGMVALIRVLKNNFLTYKKVLADKTFAKFELQIPSA